MMKVDVKPAVPDGLARRSLFTMVAAAIVVLLLAATPSFSFAADTIFDEGTGFSYLPSESGYQLVGYDGRAENAVIPDSFQGTAIASVSESAFEGLNGIKSVTIPESVKRVEAHAFKDCSSLESVTLPVSLEYLGSGAFQNCISLKSIDLPSCEFGPGAEYESSYLDGEMPERFGGVFEGCTALESVMFRGGKNPEVPSYMFHACSSLATVASEMPLGKVGQDGFSGTALSAVPVLSDEGCSLSWAAFADCANLVTASIPANTFVTYSSFARCDKLISFEVTGQGPLSTDGKALFWTEEQANGVAETTLVEIVQGGNGCYEVPDFVTALGTCAFEGSGFSKVIVPEAVKKVGYWQFIGCRNLETVEFRGSTAFTNNMFNSLDMGLRTLVFGQAGGVPSVTESAVFPGLYTSPLNIYVAASETAAALLNGDANYFQQSASLRGWSMILAGGNNRVSRTAGDVANQTAAGISFEGFDACSTVIVARDDDFADAMSAVGLAGALECPILLTSPDALSSAASAEIQRLGATSAVIVGGPSAVSTAVESDLSEAGVANISRVFGTEYYDTSAACATEITRITGADPEHAIVAYGENFQDALSMSPFAYKYKTPILLTAPGDSSETRYLTESERACIPAAAQVLVPGGQAAVPRGAAEDLFGDKCIRITEGLDGYDTSNAVAKWMVEKGLLSAKTVTVACGAQDAKGVDALAGAALAGKSGGVLLLANANDALDDGATSMVTIDGFLASNATTVEKCHVLGGSYVMPNDLVANIQGVLPA